MVDQPIFRRIMLRLERPEQRFLRSQDLYRTSRMLGKIDQAPRMTYQPRSHQVTHQCREIRSDGIHSISEVFGELGSVGGDEDDLIAERVDVRDVG